MEIKKTRWSHYICNYHFVWIPKYRKKILVGNVKSRLEKHLADAVKRNGMEIISISIQPDHVHIFVSAHPRYAPSEIVNILKGYSSRKLREEFPDLRTKHGLWARSYYVGTAGSVSEETIKRYIEEAQDA